MTREEAVEHLKDTIERLSAPNGYLWPDERKDLLDAFSILRGPVPDPDTGLVPCGCGGKAEIVRAIEYWGCIGQNKVEVKKVRCDKCYMSTPGSVTSEYAMQKWNAAMGWRADDEP